MKMKFGIVLVAISLATIVQAGPPECLHHSHTAFAALQSGVLASASYDLDGQELMLRFQNGSTYVYVEVPEDIFSGLVNAEAPGRYFLKFIRGKFASQRVSDNPTPSLVQTP